MTGGRPRILAIMGSGETAPTLARVHRSLLARLGPPPVAAVLIDTPYGFQENADDISGRTMDYFRESVGQPIGVASLRSAEVDPLARATAVARIREADYVFAGPGSPSYALRQWAGTEIPGLIADKLARGGAVTFASAAALTLGVVTVPVYEIYKVGEPPHWLPGLDLMAALGLRVAVIPHFDNAEGGNHDTRFCYLGETRLEAMERQLPDGVFVLGIDGHTALILDVAAGNATVAGLGGVTVRAHGRSVLFPAGSDVPIAALADAAREPTVAGPGSRSGSPAGEGKADDGDGERRPTGRAGLRRSPTVDEATSRTLGDAVAAAGDEFAGGLAQRDAGRAAGAVLELEQTVVEWSRDTGLAAEYDHARAVLRSLIVRLGELAADGARDPRAAVAPFVDALVELRRRAREAGDWEAADVIRDRLVTSGVAVHDTPDGTTWELAGRGGPDGSQGGSGGSRAAEGG